MTSTIAISIKSVAGSAFILNVEPSKTIADVKSLLAAHDTSIQVDSVVLIYAGKPLDDAKTLADYAIQNESTLHFSTGRSTTLPETSSSSSSSSNATTTTTTKPSPSKKSKKRCSAKNCISAPLRYVGDCQFCNGHFCSKHRLLEQHSCVGLQNCKQQLHERNAVKLQSEQTVANKV
ncbi:uncharacterized protein SAPINGB_P005018 [Magnusiomyces paraingens]|uniref:Uncharacterized protein n=1 Tax=Magnusiomyces paraingens TaxID=2606893 RepID=A0A5E8BY26_9ASCO|nr:uncharacterized protein SAPINGB_P005018 [Saprochaete ingens]VVT56374.1 unnamed protein product [Saprochaete ingens]